MQTKMDYTNQRSPRNHKTIDAVHFKLKKGLDIPISGTPDQVIDGQPAIDSVAVLGRDYVGLKPTLLVEEGERVRLGQPLFTDKKNPGVNVTAPGSGSVKSINRGAKRFLESVIIELDGEEQAEYQSFDRGQLSQLANDDVRRNLLESGLWTALRARPYGKIPLVDSTPRSIFVTAIDSNPLAADPALVLRDQTEDFEDGLRVLTRLTQGNVFLCAAGGAEVPGDSVDGVEKVTFSGPHPAGLAGTHIHFVDPVNTQKTVWYINYQDVVAVGRLFTTGRLWVERIIALGGPLVQRPRLLRTRIGASTEDIVRGELPRIESRVISGSILSGRRAVGPVSYLGRYHLQVSVLKEDRDRYLFGWLSPGLNKFSAVNIFVSSLLRKRSFDLTTTQNGSPRAMVPIGNFEEVMPLDILATPLLRSLVVEDTDTAQKLGCLELEEEDLALCSFVCSGKYDYGPTLRSNLDRIEKEG